MSLRPKDPPVPGLGQPAAPRAGENAGSRTVFSLSEEETFELGRRFASQLRGGELVLLHGELGLGKTVFARGLAAGLAIDPADVSSPSYTLIHEYRGGRVRLFHIDLYRIRDEEELATLGVEDALASGGVVVVEWGEKLPPFYRRDALEVRFHDVGEGSRRIELLPAPRRSDPPAGDA